MKPIEWPVGVPLPWEGGDIREAIINLGRAVGLRLVDAQDSFPPHDRQAAAPPPDLITIARAWVSIIADQTTTFGPELCVNGNWNMLLDLYISGYREKRISVSSLCIASGLPPTTALRHIVLLEAKGLVERTSDRFDLRRRNVALTALGRVQVEHILMRASGIGNSAARRHGLDQADRARAEGSWRRS